MDDDEPDDELEAAAGVEEVDVESDVEVDFDAADPESEPEAPDGVLAEEDARLSVR